MSEYEVIVKDQKGLVVYYDKFPKDNFLHELSKTIEAALKEVELMEQGKLPKKTARELLRERKERK